MNVTIYQYPGCSTCKKALKWLADTDHDITSIDIVKSPPSTETLQRLARQTTHPLKKFFNVAGQSYRNGGFKDRLATMSEFEQFAALAADGKLIKRPLVDFGTKTLIGFKPVEWDEALGT
ncbi:MAG: arsenate reductase [Myxococcota bacterium]|jgi:arsenate reductase